VHILDDAVDFVKLSVSVGTEDNDKMGELADTINVKVTLDMEL
jgi:hypothetical protein